MLFNCSLLVTGVCNLTNTPHENYGAVFSSYQYSKWKISNCSPEQAQMVVTNLDLITKSLPSVIQAVEQSTETAPYRIFFKHDRELPLIREVYSNLAKGEEVKVVSDTHILQAASPEFFCTKPEDISTSHFYFCIDHGTDALTFDDEPFVILCPGFWDNLYPSLIKDVPQPSCPSIESDSLLPSDDRMLESQMAIMIHELVHLYTANQIMPEVYTMRDCAELTAAKAARNSNNYTFFAMSIILNCMNWPAGMKRSPGIESVSAPHSNENRKIGPFDKSDADS